MDYATSSICDYITLFFADAVSDGVSTLTFNIPDSAYINNIRGDFALVNMADGAMKKTNNGDHILVTIKNVLNNTTSNASVPAPIGHFANVTNASSHKHMYVVNDIKYLMPPRPKQIVLETVDQDKDKKLITEGYVTLRFDYLSKPAVTEENTVNAFTPAFPQVSNF